MITLFGLVPFFGTLMGRVALAGGLVLVLLGVRACDVANQRAVGEKRAVAKIEKANDNAVQIGKKAAAKSAAPVASSGMRSGVRDPSTRD